MPTGQAAEQAAQRNGDSQPERDEDRGPGSIAGNLCADPDLRFTSTGKAVANLRIAHSDRVRDERTGEWKDGPTAFYDVTCWGTLGENCCEVLQRGDRVVAEGRWAARRWIDKDGEQQERVYLVAKDLGPSMLFRCARPVRLERKQG